jgi:DNA-binding MarR family transcriptional regulator
MWLRFGYHSMSGTHLFWFDPIEKKRQQNWQGCLLSLEKMGGMPRKSIDASVTDLSHAVSLLVRRVRATAAADGLSMTESIVVARLADDGPLTTAELARLEGMRPQSMRATIGALEKMGIVERKAHPTDGRQMFIALTRHGAELRKATRDTKRTWLAHTIAQLPAKDRETLFAAGQIMLRLATVAPEEIRR